MSMKAASTRWTRRLVVAASVTALVLSACSNSSDDGADATTGVTSPPAETTAESTTADTAAPATVPTESEPTATEAPAPTEAVDEIDLGEFQPIEGVPGVTDETISFGMLGTGPSNPLGYCLMECFQGGAQAYFDYRNSLGGVHGRQLEFSQVLDDEVGNNQAKALELTIADDVFGVFLAPLVFSGLADLGNAGMPTFTTPPAASDANGLETVFAAGGTICGSCPRKQTVEAAVIAGGTKVASLGLGASQASKDCANNNVATFEKWGPAVGIEAVYLNDDLPFGFPNGVGPEVTAMKDAGVDYITTCIDIASALLLEQELERQGMGDVTIALPQGYGDTEFISTNAALLEGDVLAVLFRPFEADIEGTGIETFLEWMDKGGYQVTDNALYAWIGADLAVQSLLAAGPQFDRASVVAAANEMTAYTAHGITAPVDWTRQHTAPTAEDPVTNGPANDCMAFVVIRGGAVELANDPSTPWSCFDPAVDEWQDAVQMNFD